MTRFIAAVLMAGWASAALATPAPVVSYLQPLGTSAGNLSAISISPDGRYLAFRQDDKTGDAHDIYLYDRDTGVASQINLTLTGGLPIKAKCDLPAVSNDALYVVFVCASAQMGLPNSQGNGSQAYMVYDRLRNKTDVVVQGTTNGIILASNPLAISPDGRYVSYRTYKLLTNGDLSYTLFLRDMVNKTDQATAAASVNVTTQLVRLGVSQEGRYLAYSGKMGASGAAGIFVFDRQSGATQPQDVSAAGVRGNAAADTDFAMSLDGKYVGFSSAATNLVSNPPTSRAGVYLRERATGNIELVTNGASNGFTAVALNVDGRYISYHQGTSIIAQYDRLTKKTRSVSTQLAGYGRLSGDGRYLVFQTNQMPGGTGRAIGLIDYGARPGLSLSAASLSLTEGGAAKTYSAVLTQVPDADVTVTLTAGAQLSLARSQLIFTPANWNVPQIVSVRAVNDGVVEGPHSAVISNALSSNDIEYSVLKPKEVSVAITDAVTPTIVPPSGAEWHATELPLTGTAAPGATVLLTAVNRETGWLTSVSAVADAEGRWAYTLTGLTDGVFDLDAQADGIKSAVQTVTVTLPQQ